MNVKSLLLLSILLLPPLAVAIANPIPIPTVPLENEDITITIERGNGCFTVNVTGIYEFGKPVGFQGEVLIKFPVPRNVEKLVVEVGGKEVEWSYNGSYLPKPIEVEMKVVQWTQPIVNESLEKVRVSYVHKAIDLGNNTFLIVYALGSSKLNVEYAKGCPYEIRLNLPSGVKAQVLASKVDEGTGKKEYEWIRVNRSMTIQGKLDLSNMFDDFYVKVEEGYPWVPAQPLNVDLKALVEGRQAIITAVLILPHPAFEISYVSYSVKGNVIEGRMDLIAYTGPVIQVISTRNVTYVIDNLDSGSYEFQLCINGKYSSSVNFQISEDRGMEKWQAYLIVFIISVAIFSVGAALLRYSVKPRS